MFKIRIAILAAAAAGGATWAAVDYFKIHREEAKKRDQIEADASAEVRIIFEAADKIVEKIRNGDYAGQSPRRIWDDYEFEKIVLHEQQ